VFFQPPYPLLAEHGKEKKKQKNWCRHLSLLLSLLTLSPPPSHSDARHGGNQAKKKKS